MHKYIKDLHKILNDLGFCKHSVYFTSRATIICINGISSRYKAPTVSESKLINEALSLGTIVYIDRRLFGFILWSRCYFGSVK